MTDLNVSGIFLTLHRQICIHLTHTREKKKKKKKKECCVNGFF